MLHITDWMPTLASLAGVSREKLVELGMDGIDQSDMVMEGGQSRRNEFVYNIKTSPFKAGYRYSTSTIKCECNLLHGESLTCVKDGRLQAIVGGTTKGQLVHFG